MTEILTINSTNLVELEGLRDRVSNTYPTTATVSFDLLSSSGTALAPPVTGVTMTYVTATTGRFTLYRGTLPAATALTSGTSYIARITATYSATVRVFDVICTAAAG